MKKAQQELSRKTKSSNRRAKAKATVARIHTRVTNQRLDATHKLTTRLTRKYSDISIKDLHVAGMVKNRHLAKSIPDAAFGEFRRQLEHKTARSSARPHVADRWHRNSKTCSGCGSAKAKPSLSERTHRCDSCGPHNGPRPKRGYQHQGRRERPGDPKRAWRDSKTERPQQRPRNASLCEARTKRAPP
mgnify:CR=1 FL=1